MKILFDTNVYVSRALTGGGAEETIEAVLRARWRVFVSAFLLAEVERVMIEKLGRSTRFARRVRRRIERECRTTRVGSSRHRVSRDVNDDPTLIAAITASVDYLVTNDDDLLCMDPYEGVRIVSLQSFRRVLRENGLI